MLVQQLSVVQHGTLAHSACAQIKLINNNSLTIKKIMHRVSWPIPDLTGSVAARMSGEQHLALYPDCIMMLEQMPWPLAFLQSLLQYAPG